MTDKERDCMFTLAEHVEKLASMVRSLEHKVGELSAGYDRFASEVEENKDLAYAIRYGD